MAYWGYPYNEMARYDDAIVELRKSLALAPYETQYNIELGFAYEQKRQWETSLELSKPPRRMPRSRFPHTKSRISPARRFGDRATIWLRCTSTMQRAMPTEPA
jgi:tetratricopeptide (TPR) repeat protein